MHQEKHLALLPDPEWVQAQGGLQSQTGTNRQHVVMDGRRAS